MVYAKSEIIYEKIKTARSHRLLTNCYSMDVVKSSRKVYEQEAEFLFSYEDHGISRLAFFAETWDGVDRLLQKIDQGKYYLEFLTKDPTEYTPNGGVLMASMMRLANTDCRSVFDADSRVLQFRNTAGIETAREADGEEINKILWNTFHTEISHLLTDDELREKIRENQITIHRDHSGHIDALLQAEIMPKKFYINQVVNKGDKNVIHAILLSQLEKYIETGGKYLYAWVEDKNTASQKFHEKYGMKHDGMWSMIYCLEK